ncbi:MAG TPA: amino acid adenylation domain-containing protein, partial [Polyangiaceae bacterium]|nr:amino acid adenylation domain-containing protein [Polyangiaceae bacterium]
GLKVLVGGEPVDPALWAALGAAERLEAYNLYGPTECTVDATAARVRDWPGPTLGRPLAGVGLYVLEAGGELAPPGVPGELCVGGVGVARGYLGRPALTAERFVPDPFSPEPGARLYRTGDLVRRLPDGRLEFLGRADHQVKVRGHRVELGEVEAALSALPGVRRAAAALRGGRLVAYVSVEGGDVAALERQLRASLPPAFVPSAIVELDDWPLLPSGKLDRARLPDPASSRPARVEPRTPAERELAALWRELLGVEQVGSNDHFFELGGHSLLATRLVARVRSAFGVELPLRALFEAPTLAALAARIDAAPPGASEPPLRRREGPAGPAPLSSAQERLWLLQRLSPESPAYNVPLALWLEGVLDRDALGRALDALAGRHEVLRSIISLGAGGPVQEVDPSFSLRPRFVDLRELAPAARAEAARALAEAEVRRPFSFDEGPPARALLVATGEREHLLVINLHHAVTDGWSGGILARELLVLYEGFAHGGPAELPPLPLQYADYAAWQRERLAGPAARAELDYWRRTLAGVPPLELPLDRARGASASRQAGHEAIALDHALSARLRAFAREAGATPFMVLATALKALLHRYSGQTDLALGTPVAGRSRPELEPLVGCFINSLVVRTDLSGDPSFADALGRVRDVTLAALTHQEAPFEQVVDALSAPRDLGLTPLFQAMLVVHAAPAPVVALPELTMRPAGAEAGAAKLDLMLELHETPAGLEGTWEYDAGLFEAATIRRLSRHFVRLLERALDAPEKPIGELELLDGAERHRTLVAWNASRADFPRDACLHHLFEAQARRAPDATAIVEGDRSLTYAGLEERAERLAAALRARGVGPERRVGVCLERSIDLVVALLGVLKAGGAYVPLDPEHPRDRLAFLVHDADPALLLTQGSLAGGLPAEGRPVLCVDREPGGDDAGPDVVDFFAGESSLPRAEHAAYVLYTSGSTGRPKGAINTHRAVVNRVWWMQSAYPLREGERVLQKTPSGFDVSVWEFFWPLAVGATLALARPGGHRDPAYLERAIGDHDVRVVHFVPSMLRAFLGALGGRPLPASLRHVVCSGEALTADLVARFFEAAAPGQQLHNLYGPTEAAIDVSAWACRPDDGRDGGPVPIGRPIANVRLYVLDRQGRPAPPGAAGELCIGGVAVGRGYLGRPALTAERFVPDPFAGEPGARLYRTGDRARWRHDGQIEFLGRLDRQVKVRGHRVEPAEIEATLAAHGALRACAVAARPAPGGDVDLVAYLVPAGGAGAAEEVAASVEAFARQRLPGALVPAHFVCLDELPTTASGKLDHRALPAPAPRRLAPRAEPRDERERELVAIWQEALGVAPLGVDDDFFEQGGNSLKALRAVARIEAALGRPLPLARLFERPTVASLLAALDAPEAAGAPYLHTFRASGRRAPLVLVHAVEGHALAYRELARALGPERPIYALRARGLEAGEAPLDDLEAMASLYLDEVRRVRPRGPYVLGGWSMGGAVAFEMARKLAQAGEGLAPVVLIDAFAPGGEVLGPEGELERLAGLGNELARRAGHAIEPVTPLELRQVPEGDRVAYLCGRAFGARGASAELAALRPEALVRVALANARALASYRSAPYAGPALLLRARAGRDEGRPRPDHGWGPLAPGLAIEDVAGDHRSVVQAPHVEGLAAAIDRWLERHEPAPG